MKVPCCCLKSESAEREVAFIGTRETYSQKDCADYDVKAMETSRHIKRGTIVQSAKGKWRDGVFVRLNGAEQYPEKDGQPKAFFKTLAVAMD